MLRVKQLVSAFGWLQLFLYLGVFSIPSDGYLHTGAFLRVIAHKIQLIRRR